MEKTFDPAAIERRIRENWESAGAFRAGRPERAAAAPYSIVIPPPNVTGNLHMGHALNNTLQDILARHARMQGKDVLWQPGTDHAGIATQMVVERQLMERQEHRRALGREKFLERVWAWKAESGGAIVEQLKRLGASCDWSRERFTLDEGLSRAVVKVFVALHREGLIYKDKRLVNWDPKLHTAISDLEVQQVECRGAFKWERGGEKPFDAAALAKILDKNPNGHLYYFDYPLEGDDGAVITVATTRPETMLGDTGVAVHPENERLKYLIGRHVILPLVGRRIPIVADEYADPEKGTGAVKITPAHDFNDFEVGKRHGLRVVNVLDLEGRVTLQGNAEFHEGLESSADLTQSFTALDSHDRFDARAKIVAMMEARGLLGKIEPNTHMVPHGDRSQVVLEPRLTDQWYVDAKTLAQPALKAVREGKTVFVPKNWEKTYFEWLDNIQPWCISRQLWWGHRIPAWYDEEGNVFVADSDEAAQAQAREKHGRDVALARDEDVLDTWFSSALWPFSTLGWPDETKELARFYPTTVLVTGFDIIFFWVARMMMMGLHFMGEVPFRDVYIHALVRDEKGAKMSKSKGNVIDPLGLIDQYGADALRFTLAAMAAQGRDIKLSTQRVEGYRNFATKLWNASRFAEINGCARVEGYDPKANQNVLNRWIVTEAARASREISAAIEAYRFNDAANAAYRFVWNIFCDWYVELTKPLLSGEDGPAKDETRACTAFALDQIYALLHPFMPFITEELWAIKGAAGPKRESLLALGAWPQLEGLEDDAAEAEIGWIVELVSEVRSLRAEMNLGATEIPLVLVGADEAARARALRWQDTLQKLARLSSVAFAESPPKSSAQFLVRGTLAALPLEGVIDLAAEAKRLDKEIEKHDAEVRKLDAKLSNEGFLAKAEEEVIDEHRERRENALARIGTLKAARTRLG
ncbi:valine--tRNA ligase [Methylocystis bryophila]|uniref:Valine--tRNA ligase n=1 Tax=Methylocystis bryophila TaxID=655015 RepID=A0A1W6MRY6_9HYPH|nr:valine--tRNA ligase [Methylocystis bryophila]ARN80370.1 valine--tRNA ligase [Methylocystis bryophila]BDV40363.1 valine--tRNA ligase [Methylocystis bryophila]